MTATASIQKPTRSPRKPAVPLTEKQQRELYAKKTNGLLKQMNRIAVAVERINKSRRVVPSGAQRAAFLDLAGKRIARIEAALSNEPAPADEGVPAA